MSAFCIYIKLERHLAEWVVHHFGQPAVFPHGDPVNAVLRTFVTKLPKDCLPDLGDDGCTAIALPDSKAKPPAYYNHLGRKGKDAVREAIRDLFLRSLWTDLTPLEGSPIGINARIAAWCEMHGIDIDRVGTVRQTYYRIREAYRKRGVDLIEKTKKKTPEN